MIAAGRKVWIAEGGPSGFTASVLRQLESTTNLDLMNIHVVQHSHGWNEEHTAPENVNDIERLTTYHRIDNGNLGPNGTPDLNQANDAVAKHFLFDPEFGNEWQAAFNYLPVFNCDRSQPHCKLDGSDAVELLWIVGVESDEIRDWSDFASRYANWLSVRVRMSSKKDESPYQRSQRRLTGLTLRLYRQGSLQTS